MNRPKSPLVSIITPSYNQGKFIEDTIKSVLSQSYSNIEYIVIDGGSNDQTIEILRKYSQMDSRLKFVSEPDNGQAHAVNKGVRMAKGEIIGWINSDDLYLPDAISKAVNALTTNPNWGMVYGKCSMINESNQVVNYYSPVEEYKEISDLFEVNFICQPSAFFRRTVFNEVGGLDESYQFAMDYEFWVRLGKKYFLGYMDQIIASARMHPESKTSTRVLDLGLPEIIQIGNKHFGNVSNFWLSVFLNTFQKDVPCWHLKLFKRFNVLGRTPQILAESSQVGNEVSQRSKVRIKNDKENPLKILLLKGGNKHYKLLKLKVVIDGQLIEEYNVQQGSFELHCPISTNNQDITIEIISNGINPLNPRLKSHTLLRKNQYYLQDIIPLSDKEYQFYQALRSGPHVACHWINQHRMTNPVGRREMLSLDKPLNNKTNNPPKRKGQRPQQNASLIGRRKAVAKRRLRNSVANRRAIQRRIQSASKIRSTRINKRITPNMNKALLRRPSPQNKINQNKVNMNRRQVMKNNVMRTRRKPFNNQNRKPPFPSRRKPSMRSVAPTRKVPKKFKRIGINLIGLWKGHVGGMEQFVKGLIEQATKNYDKEIYLFLNQDNMDLFQVDNLLCKKIKINIGNGFPHVNLQLNKWINRLDLDLWFCPLMSLIPEKLSIPSVVLIPDIQHEFYPEFFTESTINMRKHHIRNSVSSANVVLTISDFSKKTLMEKYKNFSNKLVTVYGDAPKEFLSYSTDPEVREKIAGKYGLPNRFGLYPANTWPHKNHINLLQALVMLRDRYNTKINLVLTGNKEVHKEHYLKVQQFIKENSLGAQVTFLDYVPQEDMPYLYLNANFLVYPSLFEGFGIPLLEAMRTDTPIVCSNAGSIPEVAGEAALIFNPYDPNDMANKMLEVIKEDNQTRLIEKGRGQAKNFSWNDSALKTLQIFNRLLGHP